jgi:predicted RNA-binding protein with PIN domain
VAAAETSQARSEAAAVRAALAGVEGELAAARARAEAEAAGARAAREELRAARDELRRVERERRGLADQVESLERELARSQAALRAAREEAAGDQRRLGGRVAELQARLAEAQRNYRALRRSAGQVDPAVAEAVGALERDLDTLRRATGLTDDDGAGGTGWGPGGPGAANQGGPAGSAGGKGRGTGGGAHAGSGPGAARPERRVPLAVPGGRGADDPETLAAWMATGGVLVLVDGYNVTKHPQGFADRGLEDQRTLLVDLCRRLARRFGAEVTVVFDGATVGPLPTRLPLGPIEVVFTDAGRSADDEIVVRTNAAPPERPVVVVSSDNELRDRVAALGATVARSPALLGLAAAR